MASLLRDTQEIGRDVVVGQAGWEQKLEANKQAFFAEFVARSQFLVRYPMTIFRPVLTAGWLAQRENYAGLILGIAGGRGGLQMPGPLSGTVTKKDRVQTILSAS